jgi:hypothetical protein
VIATNSPAILHPLFALAALTAGVQILIPVARVRAALRGTVTVADFEYGESAAVPSAVSLPNRNYMNLLEFPLLAYVACLMAYIATTVTPAMIELAWAFVALRALHSLIHLTYNHVAHRGLAFGASNLALVALWIQVGLHL